MGNPIEDTIRDFAVNELNKEARLVLDHDEDEIFTTIKIFGWDLWRVFKDNKKEIIKIVLKKGNDFREFTHETNYELREKRNEYNS